MDTLIAFFDRLQWWQRPLVAVLPFLVAALVLPMLYQLLVRLPLDALRGRYPKENRRDGAVHLLAGAAFVAAGLGATLLARTVQVQWLGGHQHLVAVGAILAGVFELGQGLGIMLFRTRMLGVLMLAYAFMAYVAYGLLHWTFGVI